MFKRKVLVFTVLVCVIGLGFAATMRARWAHKEKSGKLTISIRDFCDPATFNADPPSGIGPDTCLRDDDVSVNGSETLAGFRAELGQEKNVGAWRFNPDRVETEESVNLTLVNRGGETHTFTRVAQFGGGFVAALNTASGNPVPRPECAQMMDGNLVPQPPSANNIFLEHGETEAGPRIVEDEEAKFQCCIHPWMRVTFNPEDRKRD
jgi:hypothetical protein